MKKRRLAPNVSLSSSSSTETTPRSSEGETSEDEDSQLLWQLDEHRPSICLDNDS